MTDEEGSSPPPEYYGIVALVFDTENAPYIAQIGRAMVRGTESHGSRGCSDGGG